MAVRCPECGTINSGQNKYCSDCGHQIRSQTAGRCPECGAQNPANNIFCDECGHRLVPTDPALGSQSGEGSVRGLSLPRREGTVQDGVPDWLARLRASFSEETGSDQDAASATPAAEMDATPSSLLDSASQGPPSWLDDLADLEETELAEDEGESPSEKVEGQNQLPDWLRQALAKPTLPADEGDDTAENMTESDTTEEPKVDGLSDTEVKEDLPRETVPTQADDQAEEPVSDGEDSEPELLGEEFGEQPAAPKPQPSGVMEDMEPEALAGWLESLSEEPLPEELGGAEDDADELPDWLQSVAVQEDEIEAGDRTDLQNTGLPDWLQALDLQDLEGDAADELPGWLQDVTIEETPDETELGQPESLLPEEPTLAAPERPQRLKRRLPTTGPLVPDELK